MEASEGLPVTCAPELCQQLFHCPAEALPRSPRRVIAVGSGGRSGKTTRLLGPKALHSSWTVPLPTLSDGEEAVALLVAPKQRNAQQAFSIVKGIVHRSPTLKASLVGETKTTLTIRRPDNKLVRIEVGVANRGGQDARGYTLVFCGMDESSFFRSDDGYTVTDQDLFDAAIQRVVPGGQLWMVSTPWVEGAGILESFIASDWGRHKDALVAARVGTRTLNPTWDPDGSIEAAMRSTASGNDNADREILAIPLQKGSKAFFDPALIKAARLRLTPSKPVAEKGAGIDLGHTKDASALAIAQRHIDGYFSVIDLLEIKSSADQRPTDTYKLFAQRLKRNAITSVMADSHYKETLKEVLSDNRVSFMDAPPPDQVYIATRTLLQEGRLNLGSLSIQQQEELEDQLVTIMSKPMDGGKLKISAPRRKLSDIMDGKASGGSHADTVSALVLALWRAGANDASNYVPIKKRLNMSSNRSGGSLYGGEDLGSIRYS